MTTEEELRQALAYIVTAWPYHTSDSEERRRIWRLMHQLAEAQYRPALERFSSYLDDPDWAWRQEALQAIGFHYQLASDDPLIEKIRQMLLTDPDPFGFVRLSAANILGLRSQWPDHALLSALENDSDRDVRVAAFAALLQLAGVPTHLQRELVVLLETGSIDPSREALMHALAQAGLSRPAF